MWALKILHEKNWRVSLGVQELHHPLKFLGILAATPGFQNLRDLSRQTTGFSVLSSALKLDTGTGEVSFSFRSFLSRVSLSLDVAVVGEEDELEEDVEQCISCLEGVIEVEG